MQNKTDDDWAEDLKKIEGLDDTGDTAYRRDSDRVGYTMHPSAKLAEEEIAMSGRVDLFDLLYRAALVRAINEPVRRSVYATVVKSHATARFEQLLRNERKADSWDKPGKGMERSDDVEH